MAEIRYEVEAAREARIRFTARWDLPHHMSTVGPFRLDVIDAVVLTMKKLGVPSDAYVQWSNGNAWANWERPYTENEVAVGRELVAAAKAKRD